MTTSANRRISRAEIIKILDGIPRCPRLHKERVSWELLNYLNQLPLWQDIADETGVSIGKQKIPVRESGT